jgi:hypothetical protein
MQKGIGPKTTVYTDGWKAYAPSNRGGPLNYESQGWKNVTHIHRNGDYRDSQFIENLLRDIKHQIQKVYHTIPGSITNFPAWVDEAFWRRKMRIALRKQTGINELLNLAFAF